MHGAGNKGMGQTGRGVQANRVSGQRLTSSLAHRVCSIIGVKSLLCLAHRSARLCESVDSHRPHVRVPHSLQWCRRLNTQKLPSHTGHAATLSSGIHGTSVLSYARRSEDDMGPPHRSLRETDARQAIAASLATTSPRRPWRRCCSNGQPLLWPVDASSHVHAMAAQLLLEDAVPIPRGGGRSGCGCCEGCRKNRAQ